MATDDERRRVAAALRAYDGKGADADTIGEVTAIIIGAGDADGWSWREIYARLADLIDPDCEDGRYEGVHTARPVDRDALLVLADGLCDGYPYGLSHGGLEQLARHIREACGERNRERGRYE